jgi:Ca2+:H+ antiporter
VRSSPTRCSWGSASQIALFVAPVLVLLSYVVGPEPMSLQFWPGAVVMMLSDHDVAGDQQRPLGMVCRRAGTVMVYLIFAMTLYLLPPRTKGDSNHASITATAPIEHRLRYPSV